MQCVLFSAPGCLTNIVRLCVVDQEPDKASLEEGSSSSSGSSDSKQEKSMLYNACHLIFCAGGLLIIYLTWGLLQERIMSYEYGAADGIPGERFKNSQFLVFMNRILALFSGIIVLLCTRQPKHRAPLYKYSYSSFSNIMSSWCQYEALKFVSFPTQVMAKASKIIPVMLMGKIVSKKTYQTYEYVTALMISMGLSMFLLTSQDAVKDKGTVTTFSGVIILLGYLLFDAFSPNWQGELFSKYKMSSIQMMVGVNLFSVIFTSTTLIEQGGYSESLAFMARHPLFMVHVIILSICSAFGQQFIFYTISQFGAVTFTIIMTTRQGIAILLSCIVYRHPVTMVGMVGVLIVFLAIFTKTYMTQQAKKAKARKVITPQEPSGIQKV